MLPALVFGLAADPLAAGLVLVFSLAAIAASLVSARGVLQAVRWLRRR